MRVFGLPGVLERASKRGGDIPPDAAHRAAVVEFVNDRRRRGLTRDEACKLADVSARSYTRWRKTLELHGVRALAARSSRPKSDRVAWKQREIAERVEELRQRLPLGKEKLAWLLEREGLVVSASTVGRVLAKLVARGRVQACGHQRRASKQRRKTTQRAHARRKRKGERPQTPGCMIQLDTLHEYSQQARRLHYSAVDPITRYAHATLTARLSSHAASAFLRDCVNRWPHPVTSVQVDNGSEFMGAFERTCLELGLELITIPPASPKSNAHVERLQRTFRDEHYAFEAPSLDISQANERLLDYLEFYNHHRPHKSLGMRTPIEYARTWSPQTGHRS